MKISKADTILNLRKGDLKPKYIGDCVCPCHLDPIHVIHPLPCCEPCPYCGKKIARGLQSKHELYCEKKKNDKNL
jgi:hypothetical protein